MTPCIYTIQNLVTKKLYVGCTSDFTTRRDLHKSKLNKKRHNNIHLQNAWNKYGKDNFVFEIIEECDVKLLSSLEHYWCNLLNVHNREYGYNIRLTNPNDSFGHSAESKKKLSEKAMGRVNPYKGIPGKYVGELNHGSVPVYCYNKDGSFHKRYVCCKYAAKDLKLSISKVIETNNGQRNHAKGYRFYREYKGLQIQVLMLGTYKRKNAKNKIEIAYTTQLPFSKK